MYNISLGLRSSLIKSIKVVFLISLTEGIKQNNSALEKQVIKAQGKQYRQQVSKAKIPKRLKDTLRVHNISKIVNRPPYK